MAYCETKDLLLGQLDGTLPQTVDPQKFVDLVAEHIDARLGAVYRLPLPDELPNHQKLLLKSINLKRATGQLILALAIGQEENTLHAYGARLIREADIELQAITEGEVVLAAPRASPEDSNIEDPASYDPLARIPGAVNRDDYSAVRAFEERIMQGYPDTVWRPNDGSTGTLYGNGRRRAGG